MLRAVSAESHVKRYKSRQQASPDDPDLIFIVKKRRFVICPQQQQRTGVFFRRNNRRVVLWGMVFPLLPDVFSRQMREEIDGEAFAHQISARVFLISEDTLDAAGKPFQPVFYGWPFQFYKNGRDINRRHSSQKQVVD